MDAINNYLVLEVEASYKKVDHIRSSYRTLNTMYRRSQELVWDLRGTNEQLEDQAVTLSGMVLREKSKKAHLRQSLGKEIRRLHRKVNRLISEKNAQRAERGEYLEKLDTLTLGIPTLLSDSE